MIDYENLDVNSYQKLLNEKVAKYVELFQAELELPNYEVFESEVKNYRMRAEFNVYLEGESIKYYMVKKEGKLKERIFVNKFEPATLLINKFMPILAELVGKNSVLRERLFDIDFLSTLSGELLITLTYHKKLNEEWEHEAKQLLVELRKHNKVVNIIGRSYKQKIVLEQDFVNETLTVNGKQYHYQQVENSFTQPNAKVSEKMLSFVQNITKGSKGDLLELYCGNGNFSIALAENFEKVLATEISKVSVASAQENIAKNHVDNLKILRMSAEEFSSAMKGEREFFRLRQSNTDLSSYNCETILVDPPRAGLDDKTLNIISEYKNIIYVSCNPLTLYENLKALAAKFKIEKLAFFDQFPYTEHVETVCLLSHK